VLHVAQSALREAVADVLAALPAADLTVEDPPLEEVMRQLFAAGRERRDETPAKAATASA
jgi:ABC-2 type transport system ATP-binding protein